MPPAVDVSLATITLSEGLEYAIWMAADNAILTTTSKGLPSAYRRQGTFGGRPEPFPILESSAAGRLPAGTRWAGRAATNGQSRWAPSTPGWSDAAGLRRHSVRFLIIMAEGHWKQDCPALREGIREEGRRLREAARGHTSMPCLPRTDRAVAPVTPSSRNAAAAAADAGVAAAVFAGHKTEVDLIHYLEVNPGNHESIDGKMSADDG